MQSISDLNIRKMFPKDFYDLGLSYFESGFVSDLLYDINHHVWTASVHEKESFFVEIDLSQLAKGSIIAYCECAAFHTDDSCMHIVAVLLSIVQKKSHGRHTKEIANELLDKLSEENQKDLLNKQNRIPLHVEYHCQLQEDGNFYLQLRTGENRLFVVRDILHFLEDSLAQQIHYFTKTFTYDPDVYSFLKQDQEIFEFLYSIRKNEEIYYPHDDLLPTNQQSTKRSLLIPPILMKEFLRKLMDRDVIIDAYQESFSDLDIIENELPVHFLLERNDQKHLQLAIENLADGFFIENYELFLLENTFYFPTKEQVAVLQHFHSLGALDQSIPIAEDRVDMFLSEVMPSLEVIGEVKITKDVSADMIQQPLRVTLALEVNEGRIIGHLAYHYGSFTIDPFQETKRRGQMIVRDVAKEQEVMQMIEEAQFRYNGKDLYIDPDEEELYEFLYHMLPTVEEYVEVSLAKELRNLILEEEPFLQTNVAVEASTNLLEINFNVEGIDTHEINDLLKAVIEKKRYYRMESGSFIPLRGEDFSTLKNLFSELHVKQSDLEDGKLHVPAYRSAQIDDLAIARGNYDASFQNLLDRLRTPEIQEYQVPENLRADLRHYQKVGYQWFKSLSTYHLGGILADDMGLGKTVQAIAYLLSEPQDAPSLIVVPSSVVYNWKNECQKFAPDLTVEVMVGSPEERQAKFPGATGKNIWITSYATLRQDIEWYEDIDFQHLIIDEAQYIKNHQTKTFKAVQRIRAHKRFALSGTPIENSVAELWSIFQVILPGFLPTRKKFLQLSHEKMSRITKPFILRRLKEDVLQELPEKIETITVSELTEEQKKLYVGYLQRLQQETSEALEEGSFQNQRMKILAGLTRLRQICCHPSLFLENYEGDSGKLAQLLELIDTSLENKKRLLIFSQFTSMHELIITQLERQGIDYFYLHGQTPSEERVEMSERFNQGEKEIFLISLRAGGTGLNLTGADTVILYDLWWNPAVEDQAMGRAHRYGQKNVVQVIRLITEGTIEEKIYELQQKKRSLLDRIVQPGETMLTNLTEEDLRELLNV